MLTSITLDFGCKWARGALAVVALAAAASPASATVIFSDDFDANSLGLSTTPTGWSALGGTVDIVGPGLFGELCAGGPSAAACIDLDGSGGGAANLQTSVAIPNAGSYLLTFWLQPNDRGFGSDVLTVSFGGYSEIFTLTSLGDNADSWLAYQRVVNFGGAGLETLSFDHATEGDFRGILLDNVQVESVPEPGTLLLLGSGLTALAARRRRRS